MIGDSPEVLDALKRLGGERSLADTYLAATFGVLALIAAGYAVQAVLRLRGEETSGRAEPLLATSVSRTRWALSHTAIALAGTAVLLAAAGLTAGIAYAAQTSDAAQVPRLLGAALAQTPAAWVIAGVTLALFGLAPRATVAAWGVLAACLALAELGPVLELSQVRDRPLALRAQPAAPGRRADRRAGRSSPRSPRRWAPPASRASDAAISAELLGLQGHAAARRDRPCRRVVSQPSAPSATPG